MFVEQSDWIG